LTKEFVQDKVCIVNNTLGGHGMIDLHMHSSYSDDGEFTPVELVRKCRAAGITTMSITDHNSARGNKEAKQEAEKLQVHFIPGIELDCTFGGVNLHLLGYQINDKSSDFEALSKNILSQEKKASYERLKLTRKLGFEISENEMNALSNINEGICLWSGEHFAEILLAKKEYKDHPLLLPYRDGGARSVNPYLNFYWDFYGQDKPCYVHVNFPSLKEAIALIRDNGGKAVLAHPGNNLKNRFELFDEIVLQGIDGVEAFCSYHNKEDADYFYKKGLAHSLIITCGSDYHGKVKPAVALGKSGCPAEVMKTIAVSLS